MKAFLTALLMICSATTTHAVSMHPCTPFRQLMPTVMHCSQGSRVYSIEIKTLASRDIPMCKGANYFEYKTANVRVYNRAMTLQNVVQISDSDFRYKLGFTSDGVFVSPKHGLNLRNCNSPQHGGGFSIGN